MRRTASRLKYKNTDFATMHMNHTIIKQMTMLNIQ